MANMKKSVTIHAPVEKVFLFMSNPANLPEIWPSMVEVSEVKTKPDGGHSFNWIFKMGGIKFSGSGESTEVVQNKHVVVVNKSGIPSRFDWNYSTEGENTRLSVEIEYTIPIPLLSKIAEKIIVKLNEQETDNLLLNLKTRMEG